MKRLTSFVYILFLVLLLTPVSQAMVCESGSSLVSKMTMQEIKEILDTTSFTMDTEIWDTVPSLVPAVAGSLTNTMQSKALARLNAWRRLAGLPSVKLDMTYSDLAQHAAVIEAVLGNGLQHYPNQPNGMSDTFYVKARDGASSSNLTAGVDFNIGIDRLMSDHLGTSLTTVGHRRWLLSPMMGKVGFGYVCNPDSKYKKFGAVYVLDDSVKSLDYSFISWPSSGAFPNNTPAFMTQTPWSIHLNKDVYGELGGKKVQVTLTRVADGRIWTFDSNDHYELDAEAPYFNIDVKATGFTQSIVFLPNDIDVYEGEWHVRVVVGTDIIDYTVYFFNADEYQEPILVVDDLPPAHYLDVKSTHWAYPYIMTASSRGVVKGIGDSMFAPEQGVTHYEFAAMILRGCFDVDDNNPSGDHWYLSVDQQANIVGLWDKVQTSNKHNHITRYNMSRVLYNVLQYYGLDDSAVTAAEFEDAIPSEYADSVNACVYYGILQGVGDRFFDGEKGMTRAQATAVYCRLYNVISTL